MLPVRLLVASFAFAAAVAGCAPDSSEVEVDQADAADAAQDAGVDVTGYYRLGRSEEEGCKLLAQEMPADSVRVLVDCWMSPPASNQGSADAVLALVDGEAVYRGDEGDDCSIRFAFAADGAVVTQNASACGFGDGVRADGAFARLSDTPPVFYVPALEAGTQPGFDPEVE